MFQTDVVEIVKTHFVFNKYCPKTVLFEIMCKYAVHPDRTQMTVKYCAYALRIR